jgi:hypothetical protein
LWPSRKGAVAVENHSTHCGLHTTMNKLASEMAEQAPGGRTGCAPPCGGLIRGVSARPISNREAPMDCCGRFSTRKSVRYSSPCTRKLRSAGRLKRWSQLLACLVPPSHCASKEAVGKTPLEYLTTWRMQKAATSLLDGNKKLIDVATSVRLQLRPRVQQSFQTSRAHGAQAISQKVFGVATQPGAVWCLHGHGFRGYPGIGLD